MFTITPKQVYDEVLACMVAKLTPFVVGSPGLGKSEIMRQIAKDFNLKLIDIRLSTFAPEDLNGLPMRIGDKAFFAPFDTFPIEGDPIPKGYDGWLVFLDELTSANKAVQAAAYKIILDRMIGNNKLHDRVVLAAAGNKATDRAVVNQMSTALQSRLIHYEMIASLGDFTDHAFKIGIDHRIIAFVSFMPSRLMDFRPDHHDKTFACPRTWEFLSRLIKGKTVDMKLAPRIAGTIGEGVATEFITFAREFDRIPKLADILSNPLNAPIAPEMSTKYATVSMLIEHFNEDNLDDISLYAKRLDIEMQILFFKGTYARGIDLSLVPNNSEYKKFVHKMVKYIH
jgi:hypothetical protein